MEQNENLVLEEGTENVEGTTTEETVAEQVTEPEKVYTQEEFDAKLDSVLGKKISRTEAKVRKEYERKYGNLENVLKAGTGKESVEEITDAFAQFYKGKGIDIPQEPVYSARDTEILATAEANEIIRSGYDEVVEEADRLKDLGVENMSAKEKALFVKLTDHIKSTETGRELAKIGVTEDVYGSDEFKTFASKFAQSTPITEIYEIFSKTTQPKKELKTMGSMKSNVTDNSTVKDFYSREEALKFTREDFKKNPALLEAVENSMRKW